jgi:alpha-tubulin suppressor-like RCC1 family protein
LGDTNIRNTPTELTTFKNLKITQISCAHGHCLALEENGNIYSWGRNDDGELGNGNNTTQLKPILIFKQLQGVTKVYCGFHFSTYLQNGTLYTCGKNNSGKLGLDDTKSRSKFEEIKFITNIAKYHTFGHHSVAVSNKGEVYTWGCNDSGQLGLGDQVDSPYPVKLDVSGKKIVSVVCANRSTFIQFEK